MKTEIFLIIKRAEIFIIDFQIQISLDFIQSFSVQALFCCCFTSFRSTYRVLYNLYKISSLFPIIIVCLNLAERYFLEIFLSLFPYVRCYFNYNRHRWETLTPFRQKFFRSDDDSGLHRPWKNFCSAFFSCFYNFISQLFHLIIFFIILLLLL